MTAFSLAINNFKQEVQYTLTLYKCTHRTLLMMLDLKLLRSRVLVVRGKTIFEAKNLNSKCVHGEYDSKYSMTSYVSIPTVVF